MSKVWFCRNCGYEVPGRGRCHVCKERLAESPLPELEPGDEEDEVGYRLQDWTDASRGALIVALIEANVLHRFEDDELVVGAEDEARADDLIERIATEAAAEEVVAEGPPDEQTPYVELLASAAKRLREDPTDMQADADVLEASAAVFMADEWSRADEETWAAVGRVTRRLLAALGADEALEGEIRLQAGILSKLLSPLMIPAVVTGGNGAAGGEEVPLPALGPDLAEGEDGSDGDKGVDDDLDGDEDLDGDDDVGLVAVEAAVAPAGESEQLADDDDDEVAVASEKDAPSGRSRWGRRRRKGRRAADDGHGPAAGDAEAGDARAGDARAGDALGAAGAGAGDQSGTDGADAVAGDAVADAETDADADAELSDAEEDDTDDAADDDGADEESDEPIREGESVYELPEWLPEQRAQLSLMLEEGGISYVWDEGDLVVPLARDKDVEGLFGQVQGVSIDEDDEERYRALEALFAAADRFVNDPDSELKADEIVRAAAAAEGPTPVGIDDATWWAIRQRARTVAGFIESEASLEVIFVEAKGLRDELRALM